MDIKKLFLIFSISMFLIIGASLAFAGYEGFGDGWFGQGHFGLDSCNSGCSGGSGDSGTGGSSSSTTYSISQGDFHVNVNTDDGGVLDNVVFTYYCKSGNCVIKSNVIENPDEGGYDKCNDLAESISESLMLASCIHFECPEGQVDNQVRLEFSLSLDNIEGWPEDLDAEYFCNVVDIGLQHDDGSLGAVNFDCAVESSRTARFSVSFGEDLSPGENPCSYLAVGYDESALIPTTETEGSITETQPNINDLQLEEVVIEEPSTSKWPLYVGLIVLIIIVGVVFFSTKRRH